MQRWNSFSMFFILPQPHSHSLPPTKTPNPPFQLGRHSCYFKGGEKKKKKKNSSLRSFEKMKTILRYVNYFHNMIPNLIIERRNFSPSNHLCRKYCLSSGASLQNKFEDLSLGGVENDDINHCKRACRVAYPQALAKLWKGPSYIWREYLKMKWYVLLLIRS